MDRATSDGSAVAPGAVTQNRLTDLCLFLLIVTLWLVTRPYLGVFGDSQFYTIQALSALMPGRFAEDLYFQFGSQDEFTVFSQIYKPFIAAFGTTGGNLALTVLAQGFWLAGFFYLASGCFRDRRSLLAASIAVIVLPGGPLLHYGEQFLTPRLLAEALTFWALGSMLRGRSFKALLLLFLSATIHPLMTLPGFFVLFFYEAAKNKVWWLISGLTVATSLALAFGGVQPFVRLTKTFDPAWLAIVQVRADFCFLTNWNFSDWFQVGNTFALAALGLSVTHPTNRRFLGIVFIVALGGLTVSIVGGDFLHNVLIFDIQAWRATWLLAVVSHLFVGPILLSVQKRSMSPFTNSTFLIASAFYLLALSTFMGAFCLVSAPMAVIAWLVLSWEYRHQRSIPTAARVVVLFCVAALCGAAIIITEVSVARLSITPQDLWEALRGIALTSITLGACWLLLAHHTTARKLHASSGYILYAAFLLAIAATFGWDQRTPWTKFIDTAQPPASLTALLPGKSPIYWEGDVTVPWFLLNRPSYFSCQQGTGALFSRGTALNYQHRFEAFQSLQTLDFGAYQFCPSTKNRIRASLSCIDLSSVCKKELGLDAIVLTKPIEDNPGKMWVSPVKFEDVRKVGAEYRAFKTDKFFIYPCADLR